MATSRILTYTISQVPGGEDPRRHEAVEAGSSATAREPLRVAIALDASFPDPHLYLGLVRLQAGRASDAEAEFRRALALRPNGRGHHFALGMALKSQGALAEAQREFQLELAINPGEKAARDQIVEIDNQPGASHVPGPQK